MWAHMLNLSWYNPFCPYLNGNFTCNLETKAFTILARNGFWTHDQQVTCLPLSHLSYPGMLISHVQLLFEPLSVCLTSLPFPRVNAIPASIPISFKQLDAIKHQHISEMTSNNWEESINLLEYEGFFWSKVVESRMCKPQGVNISLSYTF